MRGPAVVANEVSIGPVPGPSRPPPERPPHTEQPVQLGRPAPDPRRAEDLATALRLAAAGRGHRPALTVLGAGPDGDRRDEQAFASLAQWVAKGAHLLQVDLGLGPGGAVHLDAPAGWMAASVCLAAWWVGGAVTDDASGAEATIAHESRAGGADWVLGDALDGSPVGAASGTPWALDVQAFPDQPPLPAAAADATALVAGGRRWTQTELLDWARELPGGRLGVRAPLDLAGIARFLAARPAATGEHVVLLAGPVAPEAAEAEQVATWMGD